MMTHIVKDIIIYPIKSLGGISVGSAKALTAGFEHDRRWMLLGEENKFLTQRSLPQMALFSTAFVGENLQINYGQELFSFNIHERINTQIVTNVWDDTATTIVVSDVANDWFSDMLGQVVQLVRIKDDQSRMHHSSKKQIDIPVSLADGYPYLMIGQESLKLLNDRLTNTIEMNRFRPNVVVSSYLAHEEDNFDVLDIGTASFQNVKPCGRCQLINIDQKTAEIHNEPLKVLNTYRKEGNSVLFGTNLICTKEGIVSLGDVL